MATNQDDTKHDIIKTVKEGMKYIGLIRTAYVEKKPVRLGALIVLAAGMMVVVAFAKPFIVTTLFTWLIGTWGLPLTVSKVASGCAGNYFTAQLGKALKNWVLKIDR